MNGSRYAVKVGLFVLIGLGALAALLIIFSKGQAWMTRTYDLHLRANNLGGLQEGSVVLMSGVHVGQVDGARFASDGKGVTITLHIKRQFTIHSDARFVIEQLGFLGDQYVAIYPQANAGPPLKPGDTVSVEESFNLQETARSANELLKDLKKTAQTLNEMLTRVDRTVLSEQTLTNASMTIANFRLTSDRMLRLADSITILIETNSQPIYTSVSNLVQFSEAVQTLAREMSEMVASNKTELTKAINSLDNVAQAVQRVIAGIDSGKGLAGALVKDDQLKGSLNRILLNLETATSNINKYGLLYKPKPPKKNVAPPALPPKDPFQ